MDLREHRPSLIDNLTSLSQAQPWDEHVEAMLAQWATEAQERSHTHEKAAQLFRMLRMVTGLPLVLACMVMAPLCSYYAKSEAMRTVEMWTFLACGCGQALLYLLDFSGRAERHSNYAARYADMGTDINDTLMKPFRCRPLADVFVMRVKTARKHLNRNAPDPAWQSYFNELQ